MARDLNEFERGILANVEAHGCQVNHIFGGEGDEPDFSYSIGFPQSVGQPEVIVFGLGVNLMKSMINELRAQCAGGLTMADRLRVADLLDGFECELRSVDRANIAEDFFASAMWFERYRTGEQMTEAFQIVWPGASQGLFPWEDGCNPFVGASQTALYEQGTVH